MGQAAPIFARISRFSARIEAFHGVIEIVRLAPDAGKKRRPLLTQAGNSGSWIDPNFRIGLVTQAKPRNISGILLFPWLEVRSKSEYLNSGGPARSLVVETFSFKINKLGNSHSVWNESCLFDEQNSPSFYIRNVSRKLTVDRSQEKV